MRYIVPIRIALAIVVVASVVVALGAGSAAASTKSVECQHPLTTGQEAIDLHHISGKVACQAVRKLAKFLNTDDNAGKLYRCKRPHPDSAGTPILKIHKFDGYRLHISRTEGLVMAKGRSSFGVAGTDFPLNCS